MAKVYVSSTRLDLEPERKAVIDWLVQARHQPVHSYVADTDTVRDSCVKDVANCDAYVLILGHRYGHVPPQDNPQGHSITELEYRQAAGTKPCIVLTPKGVRNIAVTDLRNPAVYAKVEAFHTLVNQAHRAAEFSDEAGLIAGLSAGLQQALHIDPLDDPEVQRTIAKLALRHQADIEARDKQLAQTQGRVQELEAQLAAAIARTFSAARAPGASPMERTAAQALRAGDSGPAEELLRVQAVAITEGAAESEDPAAERMKAAGMARDRGALLYQHNVLGALQAYREAADLAPEDLWAQFFVGDLCLAVGDLAAAADAYEAAQALAARRASDPSDAAAQRDLSVSQNKIGDVRVAQGDLAGALNAYGQSLAIYQTLVARDPASSERQRDLSISHDRIGNVHVAQGDLAGALDAYTQSMAIRRALVASDPSNTLWQRDLAISHNKIGNVRVAQGDLAGALEAYVEDLAIAQTLADRDPANTQWQRDLSISHNKIGDVRVAQGDVGGALEAYGEDLAIAQTLAERDPANTQWQRDLSISHDRIANVFEAQGDLAGALNAVKQSLAIRQSLADRDPANTEWQRDLSISHEKTGNVRWAQGDLVGALDAFRLSLAIRQALAGRDPANTQWQVDLAVSNANLGKLPSLDSSVRRQHLARGRDVLVALKQAGRLTPNQDHIAWFDARLAELGD